MSQIYPVTTPFGQVAGYPLNNGYHNGIDYAYPMGTPVVVNGVTIGLSNNSGASTGPHLHVGKWVNGVVQNPGTGGFNFNSAVVFDTGTDPTNGTYVRITGDGALWNYLHLGKSLVTKGQVLKGGTVDDKPTSTQVGEEFQALAGRQPRQDEVDLFIGLNWFDGQKQYLWPGVQVYRDTIKNLEHDRDTNLYPYINSVTAALGLPIGATSDDCVKAINDLKKANFVPVTEQLFKKG